MDAEIDSIITNTGVSEKYTMKQEKLENSRLQMLFSYVNNEM
ncbi:hypothetical protein T07_5973 [Trichinella nelsoni]|uniref:Uncharacterized protein n=1 Tax=Trichinella nelsoni TaxID=6336 RepID=A0A0V0RBU4_9BILA|nr:hypothetical protein T07_5973 [Trichinella nelsoni]